MKIQAKADYCDHILFVDLDGTLLSTDLLCEGLIRALKYTPWVLPRLASQGWQGRAPFKKAIAELVTLDLEELPYREEVLDFLRKEKALGRTIVLATASDRRWAQQVSEQLGLFDDIIASDGEKNLKGAAKLAAIEAYCQKRSVSEFSYIGDASADLPIWRRAARVYAVAPDATLFRALQHLGRPVEIFGSSQSRVRPILRELRVWQWVKNALLLVPLLLAHEAANFHKLFSSIVAFFVFSLSASAVYVLNDLLDITADRHHPSKRHRPLASGTLPLPMGPPLALGLLVLSTVLSFIFLPWSFLFVLTLYLILTTTYSFWLKRVVLVDILMLAGLYTLRLVAGGIATTVPLSEWLMAFSSFFFTSLAFAKRYAELSRLETEGKTASEGRGYEVSDLSFIETAGLTSGSLAVLVFALYINSEATKRLYTNVWALWLICPLLYYWIGRIWLLARRRQLSEDPVIFAAKDLVSLCLGILAVLLVVLAAGGY